MPSTNVDAFILRHRGIHLLLRARVRVYRSVSPGDRDMWLARLLGLLLDLYVEEMRETGARLGEWRLVSDSETRTDRR